MTTDQRQPEDATPQPAKRAPKARDAKRVAAPRATRAPKPKVVLRFVGDGSIFQSGVPNRDVLDTDRLDAELIQLAVDTKTHVRV